MVSKGVVRSPQITRQRDVGLGDNFKGEKM